MSKYKNIEIYNYLTTNDLNNKILESNVLIARSGYSTIMDLVNLETKAILIPTPGQTEQEYLAEQLHAKGIFFTMKQNELNLQQALERVEQYSGFRNFFVKQDSLREIVNELLNF